MSVVLQGVGVLRSVGRSDTLHFIDQHVMILVVLKFTYQLRS